MEKSFTEKLWKVMKLCAVQGMAVVIFCGVALAHDNFGQVLDKPVTIELSGVPFEQALKEIEKVANISFSYSIDQIKDEAEVSLIIRTRPLRELLNELCKPRNIEYKVYDKEATITLKKQIVTNELEDDESSTLGSNLDDAFRIQGVITDAATAQPMAGVNVIVKGTTVGSTTDADGKFSIAAAERDVLVFSFIGYKTIEEQVNERTTIDVALIEDAQSLNEVTVNAGYWDVKDKERTGNIGRVTAKEIAQQPVSNPLAALQGRVPGLDIVQQSGVPGGSFKVRIRGTNSIANGNDPLFIIDGVPFTSTSMAFNETSRDILFLGTSPLNGINPSDIESIEVLKDADATAIYGSRGSNGVILITTKKGKSGKTKIDINFYTGVGKVASKMELLNSQEYLQVRRQALNNEGLPIDASTAPDLINWDTTRYTDWQEELLGGAAKTTDAQFSISGGDRYTQFNINGGFHQEGTVFPGSNSDRRFSTLMSISNNSGNERLKSTISVKYAVNNTDLIKRDLTTLALSLAPIAPAMYNEEGELNWNVTDWDQYFPNPLSYLKTQYEANTKNLLLNANVSYSLLQNLFARVNMGYTNVLMNAVTTTPKSSLPPAIATTTEHMSTFSTSAMQNWTVEPQLNWRPKLGRGRFDILLGTTFLSQLQEGLAQIGRGYADESLMKNLAAASIIAGATNYYSQYRYNAVFGRLNYVWNDRYIINVTGRRDGSSRFGPGRRFANFGAIGLAWIFSEEQLIKNALSFLSFGKLRGSYGVAGNDQLPNYEYMDTYTSSGTYGGIPTLKPVRLANSEFAWETNHKLEAGLELAFIHNRIETSVSYFRNKSSNQLVGLPLPPTTGFRSVQGNFPAVVLNTGLELELTTRNFSREQFSWTTSLNFYIPRNELLEFPNLESSPAYANTLVVGEPLSIRRLYNYTGINPATGYYQMEDLNNDEVINVTDQKSVRYVGLYYSAGLLNTIQAGGFQLDMLFQYVNQTKSNYLGAFPTSPGMGQYNQPDWILDQHADIQRYSVDIESSQAYSQLQLSTRSVTDASFLRLKNVAISYSIPSKLLTKLHMTAVRVFVQGQNLFTYTDYLGLDPETENSMLPPLRVYSLGFHFTF